MAWMIELKVNELGQRGDGIAEHEGERIYIDRALPDEIVQTEIKQTKDGFFHGEALDIIQASPNRSEPDCPYYKNCGGCQLQHMKPAPYRAFKVDQLRTALARKDITAQHWHEPEFIAAGTRRRATFALLKQQDKIICGYHKRRSKQIQHIDACLILDPDILRLRDAILPLIKPMLKDSRVCDLFIQKVGTLYDCVITGPIGKKGNPDSLEVQQAAAEIIQNTDVTRLSWRLKDRHSPELLLQKNPFYMRMGALNIELPPLAFLQPSIEGQQALIKTVLSFMPDTPQKVADLFAGNGTFAGHLMAKTHQPSAYEGDRAAVKTLKKAGLQQAYKRDLFKEPLEKDTLNQFDVIVLDPPRAGAKAQSEILAKSDVKTIIYLSCNPRSFARDAAILQEAGYLVSDIKLIDQFPWSSHSELVAKLTKV